MSQKNLKKMSELQEKGVSNNSKMRSVSDKVDSVAGWEGGYKDSSSVRGAIHGVYHTGVGAAKYVAGNKVDFFFLEFYSFAGNIGRS